MNRIFYDDDTICLSEWNFFQVFSEKNIIIMKDDMFGTEIEILVGR